MKEKKIIEKLLSTFPTPWMLKNPFLPPFNPKLSKKPKIITNIAPYL